LLCALVLLSAPASSASTYPTRPIRIVTSEPGGGNDILARIMAEGINSNLPQRAIVDNRGIVAAEIAAKAAPDGHTLLVYGSNIWLMPFLRSKVAWDPLKDFTPVTLAVQLPNILVVHPNMTVKSVKELITLAKSKPGELNYAAGTIGVSPHLAAELFKSLAGVNLTMVPYKGGGPALNGLIGGETNLNVPQRRRSDAAYPLRPGARAGGFNRQTLCTGSRSTDNSIDRAGLRNHGGHPYVCTVGHTGSHHRRAEPRDHAHADQTGSEGSPVQPRR